MSAEPPSPETPDSLDHPHDVVLQVQGLTVLFGGLMALGGIDLAVARGERVAILGPNGAGKTTLFNVIAGDLQPTSGSVHINGQDCSTQPSRTRPGMGVARTYQKTRTFAGLSVEDNLYLAVIGKAGRHRSVWRTAADRERRDRARAAAESVWLTDKLNALAGDLSHGEKRQLEVGMAVATDPDTLLLDEPASGLSRGERERLIELLGDLGADSTLLLIEHDMDVAFKVADRVFVMADGLPVAEGTPEEIRANEQVHEIYLGRDAA